MKSWRSIVKKIISGADKRLPGRIAHEHFPMNERAHSNKKSKSINLPTRCCYGSKYASRRRTRSHSGFDCHRVGDFEQPHE